MSNNFLQWVGWVSGPLGVLWAVFEYYRRLKLEHILKTLTQSYPGDVAKIEESCTWAFNHSRGGLNDCVKMPDCPEKSSVLEHLNLATADSAAAARMCHVLFNQLMVFQQAQFGTRIIIHAEKDNLDLTKAEIKSRTVIP